MLMLMPLSIVNQFLTPVSICVVLPVLIVWLYTSNGRNETNRRAEIILAALEKGKDTDLSAIIKQLAPDQKKENLKWRIVSHLRTGCILIALGLALLGIISLMWYNFGPDEKELMIFGGIGLVLLLMGVGFLIVYFVSRRFMAKEIASEEQKLAKAEENN